MGWESKIVNCLLRMLSQLPGEPEPAAEKNTDHSALAQTLHACVID